MKGRVKMDLEKMVQRLNDIHEIQNVMSKHSYYHSAGLHKEEFEDIWAQKTPGIAWANNTFRWEGWESVKNVWVDQCERMMTEKLEAMSKRDPNIKNVKENRGIGMCIAHHQTTPIIEVAGDGKTAKGVWMSPGQVTDIEDGEPKAYWTQGKYGVDFVKEDGKWKIWHMHGYGDFYCPVGENWVDHVEEEKGEEDLPSIPDKKIISYYSYSKTTVPLNEPRMPEPYETFDETFSY